MTLTDLLTQLAYRLNKNASTLDTTTTARLTGFLNQRQRRILSLPGMQHLRQATTTFASVADTAAYVLVDVSTVDRIWDATNQRVLWEMSGQDYRLTDPDPIAGTPQCFVWRGLQQVAVQPSDASEIFVKSTSLSDTIPMAFIEGVITGGYQRSASRTLSGTTAVSLSTVITTWTRIDKFYLSAAPLGTVTLHEDSGSGTELASITIGKTSTRYMGLTLWPTPAAAVTYTVDYTRLITDLSNGSDVPQLPEDFHDLILLGALADEYQHQSDDRYAVAMGEYRTREGQFRYAMAETATGKPMSLARRQWQRPSQLGGWYPANT